MKKLLLIFIIFLILIGAIFLTQKYIKGGTIFFLNKTPVATINNHSFRVSAAVSQKEHETGLSKTQSLSEDQGMIFLFEKPEYYSFWMKNMKFPVDIIYINNDKIVTIKNNAAPPKNNEENLIIYTPTGPSDKVLEIQAGLSEKYGFKIGDTVKYENLGN